MYGKSTDESFGCYSVSKVIIVLFIVLIFCVGTLCFHEPNMRDEFCTSNGYLTSTDFDNLFIDDKYYMGVECDYDNVFITERHEVCVKYNKYRTCEKYIEILIEKGE